MFALLLLQMTSDALYQDLRAFQDIIHAVLPSEHLAALLISKSISRNVNDTNYIQMYLVLSLSMVNEERLSFSLVMADFPSNTMSEQLQRDCAPKNLKLRDLKPPPCKICASPRS